MTEYAFSSPEARRSMSGPSGPKACQIRLAWTSHGRARGCSVQAVKLAIMLPPIQCPRSKGHGCRAPQAQGRSKCGVLRLTLSQLLPLHPTNSALISGASHTGKRARCRRRTVVTTWEAFPGEITLRKVKSNSYRHPNKLKIGLQQLIMTCTIRVVMDWRV